MNLYQIIKKPFRYSFFNAALIIIGVNIGVFLITILFPELKILLSMNVLYVTQKHAFWQFFTYMFVHADFYHLLFNMLGIFFFGMAVERSIGSKEFLLLYLVSGFFCGIISFFFYWATGAYLVILLGASGAIYSLLLAYAVVFPNSKIYIWGILPVPAPILVAAYAGIEIGSQLLFARRGNVAHMTHLAGFAVAWLYFLIRMGINPWKVWKNTYQNG